MPDAATKQTHQRTPNGCLTVTGWGLNPSIALGLARQGAFDTRWVTYRIRTGTFDSNVAAMTI